MTTTRTTAQRLLALAQLRLTSVDEAALLDARDYVARALFELEHLRGPDLDPIAVVLGRALRTEHISAPLGRAIEKLKQGGEG